MRRRVNGEAISETDWGSFQSFKVKKNQVGLEAEVGRSTKGEKDQSGRDLLAGHFFRAQTHVYGFYWDA